MLEAETKTGSLTGDLLTLPTISRDQTSESQSEDEKLTVLVKPASEADNRLDTAPNRNNTRAHSSKHSQAFIWPASSAYQQSPPAPTLMSASAKDSDGRRSASSGSSLAAVEDAESSVEGHSNPRPRSPDEEESWRVLQTDSIHEHPTIDLTKNYRVLEQEVDHISRKASPKGKTSLTDLLDRLKSLEHENHELRNGTPAETYNAPPLVPHYTWRTFHCIEKDIFLEAPQWMESGSVPFLRADKPLKSVDYYLEQHPEIAFVFYKDYHSRPPADLSRIISKDGIFRTPEPSKQSLSLISEHIISAVETMEQEIPNFSDLIPDFNVQNEIPAPYLFIYYSMPLMEDVKPYLTSLENDLLGQLYESILSSHGKEYVDSKRLAAKGKVTKQLVKYLIRPGDVLVRPRGPCPEAYMASSWAKEGKETIDVLNEDYEPNRNHKKDSKKTTPLQAPSKKTYSWEISAWSWGFDGSFYKRHFTIPLYLTVSDVDMHVKIDSLDYFPLQYGSPDLRMTLEKRGRMFWKCRNKHFVSYQDAHGALSSIDERYIVDIETYKTLHPEAPALKRTKKAKSEPAYLVQNEPPREELLLLFPSTTIGYNLRLKIWVDLFVDRISEIKWNKQAFESLVVNEKPKELVQALITNQLAAEKSTDLITGKGNGLTILLHGGPGTGKTFTAEGVAEIAEKPLYRVTCGDVGTKPEAVEKYLESVLNLGKIWDCVVLLDDADVFLEERGLADLQRNALVSVFLRVLEYNVGILILTSNRVGTFDEAFKSRIQLALHYKNLTASQQRKIWRNFLSRLKTMDGDNIDFDDIIDHIDELGNEDMNGRQIRNAITTARQLALYKGKKFCYEHLRHVIEVSGEFETYLKGLREGYTDDQIKRDGGLR